MIIIRTMGERGQVVIPKDIREMLGLEKNSEIEFEVKNDKVTINRKNSEKDWEKFFNSPIRAKKGVTIKEIKKIREESYDIS